MKCFSRVYPKLHTDSKHYDPVPWWVSGAQLVALNFQKKDEYFGYNQALFMRNKNCGYVLKPRDITLDN